VQTVRHRDRA